jgi:hypothetical protein
LRRGGDRRFLNIMGIDADVRVVLTEIGGGAEMAEKQCY